MSDEFRTILRDCVLLQPTDSIFITNTLEEMAREYNLRDITQRSHKMPSMPHSSVWQRELSQSDESKSISLIHKAQAIYNDLLDCHLSGINRANLKTWKLRVLPGYSIYKALLDEIGDQERALADVEILFSAAFFTKTIAGIGFLNYLPDPFSLVRKVLKMMTRNAYLPGSQEVIADNRDCFAMHVYRCFILDSLRAHNATELTVLFCKADDWMAGALPKVKWERTVQLSRGDSYCDFYWSRI